MLPRANIYDVATFVCLPDGPQRVRRHLGKRFGSSRPSLRASSAILLVSGWTSVVTFVVIWLAGLGLLTIWAPMGPGKIDLHLRLSLLAAWVFTIQLFWVDLRLLRLRQRIGRRVRLSGLRGEADAAEVTARRAQWNTLIGKDKDTEMVDRLVGALPVGMLMDKLPHFWLSVSLVVWTGAGLLGAGLPRDAAYLFVVVGLLGMVGIRQELKKKTAARFVEVSRAALCPECRYLLRAHLNQLEPTTGRTVGPPRCPECGTHWPLVPPPCFVRIEEGAGRKRSGQIPRLVPPGMHAENENKASVSDRPASLP